MSFSKRQLNRLAGNVPVGTVLDYAGANAPFGYLLCDGSPVSRATYSDLFAAIGTSFGAGDGSTTFNLPDLRGKVGVGRNSGTFATLGASGGAEAVALTASQSGMPAHGHGHTISAGAVGNIFADPGHLHYPSNSQGFVTGPVNQTNLTTGGSLSRWLGQSFAPNGSTSSSGTGAWTVDHAHPIYGGVSDHGGANASSGHTNLQPYQVVNKIIRFAAGATVASPIRNEVPTGTINGSNAVFNIANIPSGNTQEVYLNGVRQRPGGGFDYTISGTTITFTEAPPVGSHILVDYFVGG